LKTQSFNDRIEFLCALKEVGWWSALREFTWNRDHKAALRLIDGFFESYQIRENLWLRETADSTIDYWYAFPESPAAKLGHFVPVFPTFEPPDDPRELDARLQKFAAAWKAVYRPMHQEIAEVAVWTALRFCGKPAAAIARDNCSASVCSKDPVALVEKSIRRFAQRIDLTIPDHSRCPCNQFVSPYRAARIAHA
jgi:hypothetical protein